jgi:hypothetical protein
MARGEHDRPDSSLIVEGSRKSHPSKRIQGNDYPITPLEELDGRLNVEGDVMEKYIGDFYFDDEEYID